MNNYVNTLNISDDNQRMVTSLFPLTFHYLQLSIQPGIVKSLASLIGLTVANNGLYSFPFFFYLFHSLLDQCRTIPFAFGTNLFMGIISASIVFIFSIFYPWAAHNQYRVVTSGGLDTLVAALHRMLNNIQEQHNEYMDSAISLTITLDTVISDNGMVYSDILLPC